MSTYDLEEQEQLEQLKAFWQRYGGLISGVVLVAALAVAGYQGWNKYQNQQASSAAGLFDEAARFTREKNVDGALQAYRTLKEKHPSTAFAQQAALAVAEAAQQAGKSDEAVEALRWASTQPIAEYAALAKLRLAGLLMERRDLKGAMAALDGEWPAAYLPLVEDRRGDILAQSGDIAKAQEAYRKAYTTMDSEEKYRNMIRVKLGATGVDVSTLPDSAASAASGAQ